MRLPPEVNLIAVANYLQALDVQRKANQVVAILGSKTPNIQNLAVGGVATVVAALDGPPLGQEDRALLSAPQCFKQDRPPRAFLEAAERLT